MKRIILASAILLSTTVLAAASLDPLNVKTGLWQVTMTSKLNELAAPNTTTYESCVRKEDLNKYPFTDPGANCTWNVVSSTASNMEANGTCMPEGMGEVKFSMHLEAPNSVTVKGTGQMTANGPTGTMKGSYVGTAKWVGANCPANVN